MAIDRDKVLQTAQKHVDKKRYDKAIVEYRRLVAEDPGDVRTLLKIGDLHLKLDQHEHAISTYEQVGEYYYREGFSVKAIAVYKQIRGIIRRHAAHLEGRYGHIVPRLAEIYTQLGLTSDALAAYDEVATRLRQEGRERDALDIFKKVVELDPQNPIAHLRVADSRARLGDIDKAVDRFGEAASIMVKLGRQGDALKVLERLLEYRQDPRYARMSAELFLERGGPNDGMAALTKLQLAFKANPKDLETLEMLAKAFDAIGQPKKAIEVLKESARIAKEAGDTAAFHALVDTLMRRAPEDTLVVRLAQQRMPSTAPDDADVSVEVLDEAELESMEEVFELDEGELLEHGRGETGFDTMLEGPGDGESSGVRRLLIEAERQQSAGHAMHAVSLLRDGLRNMGGSHALRHKLSDLLLEIGDTAGCITEKLILGQELANEGNVERALSILDEVLLLQPGQPDAAQMRANLGYPLAHMPGRAIEDVQLSQPLQSYDVESGGVEEALHRSRHHSAPAMPAVSLDDPFGSGYAHPAIAPHPAAHYPQAGPHHAAPPMAQHHAAHHHQAPPAARETHRSAAQLNEDALDRAEALAVQGRYDEARALLHGQLAMLPNHPLIMERLADIDAMSQAPASVPGPHSSHGGAHSSQQPIASSPPIPVSHASASYGALPPGAVPPHAPGSQPIPLQSEYDQDYAQQQAAYDQQYEQYPQSDVHNHPSAHYHAGSEYQSSAEYAPYGSYAGPQLTPEVDAVLDQVRQGVRNQVAESDAATHYDLGVAYYEMGLHSDAISELTLASRDPSRECVCLSMIGTIQLQVGDYDSALEVLHRALNSQYKTADQELALAYEIANTYEMKMMPEQALHYFEWLASVHPSYMDPRGTATERTHRLRSESGAQPRPQAPYGGASASEMNEAFDDLFEEGQ